MPTKPKPTPRSKASPTTPLSPARILRCAITLADESGLDALSMRKIASSLGVEAMSLYNHVANKEDILDGIIDLVVGEIELPAIDHDWRAFTRHRAISARAMFVRHPWAPFLLESRTHQSAIRLRYADASLGALRRGGFAIELAYNALLVIDSYVYGFVLQEVSWPHAPSELPEVVADLTPRIDPQQLPYMAEMMAFVGGPRDATNPPGAPYEAEFLLGLDLVLDGLQRLNGRPRSPSTRPTTG